MVKVKHDIHSEPVTFMAFNPWLGYGISFDGGMAEVWDPETLELPSWLEMISDTDLYDLCETKVVAVSFSQEHMAVFSTD